MIRFQRSELCIPVTSPVTLTYNSASWATFGCTNDSDQNAVGLTLADSTGKTLQAAGEAMPNGEDTFSFGGPLTEGAYVVTLLVADNEACSGSLMRDFIGVSQVISRE